MFSPFFFFLYSVLRGDALGEKIIFLPSSSVIPSVNSSAGISLLSDARWHYLLRGRWLQSATRLNSPRRCWDGGTSWHPVFMVDLWVCVCVSEPRESSATVACACGQEGRKPPRTKGIHIQVLNGLCDCHHHSLILLCEGIKMIQGWKKMHRQEGPKYLPEEEVTYIRGLAYEMGCRPSPATCLKCVSGGF